jgi:hypothetical protein
LISPAIVTFPASFSQRPLDQAKLLPPVSPLDGSMTAGPNSAGGQRAEAESLLVCVDSLSSSGTSPCLSFDRSGRRLFYPLRYPFAHCGWSPRVHGPYISVRQGVSWRVPVLCSSLPFPIYRPGRLCGDRLCGGHPLVTSCFTPFTDIFGTRDAVAGPHGCVGPFDGGRVVFA